MQVALEKGTVGPCPDKPANVRCLSCILDTSEYFRELSIPAKRALQRTMQIIPYERHELLYSEGERTEGLYILFGGEVKLYKTLSDGRQQIHRLGLVPGDLIGCEDLFLDRHGSSAETLTDASVCRIQKAPLRRVAADYPEVSDTLLRTMARNLNSYVRHVANLGQKNAVERLASYLLFMDETHEERHLCSELLMESLTRDELADMLGVTQRTLMRSLKTLKADEVIAQCRGGFVILDRAALQRLGEGASPEIPARYKQA
jgi:CRP/FNR family transcriptional regulator